MSKPPETDEPEPDFRWTCENCGRDNSMVVRIRSEPEQVGGLEPDAEDDVLVIIAERIGERSAIRRRVRVSPDRVACKHCGSVTVIKIV